MLQKWLDGKKKYSAFLITIFGVILASVNIAPEAKAEIESYIPMLATIISGVAYLIIEGRLDNTRAKAAATNGAAGASATLTVDQPITSSTKQAAAVQTQSPSAVSAATAAEPFDAAKFDALVEERAKQNYLEANDITRYFAAQDLGATTKWSSLYHQLAFQDYMVNKAMKAFESKFGFPYNEADKHLGDDGSCPYYSVDNMARQKGVDFWYMLRMVRNTLDKAEELSNST